MLSLAGRYLSGPSTSEKKPEESDKAGQLARLKTGVDRMWNRFAYGKWRRTDSKFTTDEHAIWLLGRTYRPQESDGDQEFICPEFEEDFVSRIWLSYREDFECIEGSKATTDCGWGCMLRSAQMMLAHALVLLHFGRDWRLKNRWKSELSDIIRIFEDRRGSPLGIHALMALAKKKEWDSPIGRWYSPSEAISLVRDCASNSDNPLLRNIRMYVSIDNCVARREVEELSEGWSKSVLIFVCVRLGTKHVNKTYEHSLRSLFSFENFLGAIGGRPKHAVYFVGFVGADRLFYLDPHTVQKYQQLGEEQDDDDKKWKTFHCRKAPTMQMDDMDPSCALGFLVRSHDEFAALVDGLLQSNIIFAESDDDGHALAETPLFSVVDERIEYVERKRSKLSENEQYEGFEIL
ncbi:CRE-ATG-4.2 protein [Aphelenchoides avenae]|nr:CRE-ATG-4.2 protein [Aphelenchus avenae]